MSDVYKMYAIIGTVILLVLFGQTIAQFPSVCIRNATKADSTCCPVPKGFSLPCGGPSRGRCTEITDRPIPKLPLPFSLDDRLNWPKKFFKNACLCEGNFDGYQCSQCAFGFDGQNCIQRRTSIRKNAVNLEAKERKLLRDVLDASKFTASEWMVMNITSKENVDPVNGTDNLNFIPVSVYDFYVYLHVYGSRSTLPENKTTCTTNGVFHLDFGHIGSGFITWHRLLLLALERDLKQIALERFQAADFTLPYWDWVDDGQWCEVCTPDLFGSETLTTIPYPKRLDASTPFSKWKVMCDINPRYGFGCRSCDPAGDYGYLYRWLFTPDNPVILPTRKQVDFMLSRPVYDTYPYQNTSDNRSFRNVLEGFAKESGLANFSADEMLMHNVVHQAALGHFGDQSSSLNDPIFLAHHTFVDKLFEMWLRKNRPSLSEFPVRNAPIGHNRDEYLVPFFPPFTYTHAMMFADSRNLGYDYDTMKLQADVTNGSDSFLLLLSENSWILGTIIEGIAIVILIAVVIVLANRRRRSSPKDTSSASPVTETSAKFSNAADLNDDETPLVSTERPVAVRYGSSDDTAGVHRNPNYISRRRQSPFNV
ncbi:tyrosinase-like [Tubulanus polymorphus]|uniref:tyrosinase-like n=1 Tax=Tubulanus polymorphus TaxID=672921 RepID=UPI003DA3536A